MDRENSKHKKESWGGNTINEHWEIVEKIIYKNKK